MLKIMPALRKIKEFLTSDLPFLAPLPPPTPEAIAAATRAAIERQTVEYYWQLQDAIQRAAKDGDKVCHSGHYISDHRFSASAKDAVRAKLLREGFDVSEETDHGGTIHAVVSWEHLVKSDPATGADSLKDMKVVF